MAGTTLTMIDRVAKPVHEPCCPPGACQYRVGVIRYVQWLRQRCAGEDLHEAASSFFDPCQGYEMGRSDAFGPAMEARWALLIGEIEAADQAGARTPEEIAARLCPYALTYDS